MTDFTRLKACLRDLTGAVKELTHHIPHNGDSVAGSRHDITPGILIPPEAPPEAHRARKSTLAAIHQLEVLLGEPTDFLQRLAIQVSYKEGTEVLACIPLHGSVPMKDVSDLADVPEARLWRVVRMTATAGFLQEPEPGSVAHTALSALFFTKPSHLDAAMFLAGTLSPAALQMADTTKHLEWSEHPKTSSFASHYEQQPRLQRQCMAYLRYATGDASATGTDILTCLERLRGSNAHVVEV
ncbi:hypothetical protein EYZ11_007061 [Aspergillus tanneri]|nr:hypothetical protein EYZ11_007061 [Aspergillus tanneri]